MSMDEAKKRAFDLLQDGLHFNVVSRDSNEEIPSAIIPDEVRRVFELYKAIESNVDINPIYMNLATVDEWGFAPHFTVIGENAGGSAIVVRPDDETVFVNDCSGPQIPEYPQLNHPDVYKSIYHLIIGAASQ